MLRDFSDEAKQKLLQYVKDVTSTTTWDTITDFFGDIGLTVQGWFGKLDIQNYVNDVDAYHKKILDKNDTTTQQIETIFTDVQAVDTKYISVVSQQISCGNNIIKLINDLCGYDKSKWRKYGYEQDERCLRGRRRGYSKFQSNGREDHRGKDAWNGCRRLYEQ